MTSSELLVSCALMSRGRLCDAARMKRLRFHFFKLFIPSQLAVDSISHLVVPLDCELLTNRRNLLECFFILHWKKEAVALTVNTCLFTGDILESSSQKVLQNGGTTVLQQLKMTFSREIVHTIFGKCWILLVLLKESEGRCKFEWRPQFGYAWCKQKCDGNGGGVAPCQQSSSELTGTRLQTRWRMTLLAGSRNYATITIVLTQHYHEESHQKK